MREWANGFARGRVGTLFGDGMVWRRELAVAVVAGCILGVLGPFGSYFNGPPPVRLAYWVTALLFGSTVVAVARAMAAEVARRVPVPPVFIFTVATMLAAMPIAFVCHMVATSLWSGPIRQMSGLTWYVETLIISAILTLVHYILAAPGAAAPARRTVAGAPGDFLARVPPHLGRDLLALQMEDHYVRAHTRLGSALILIPLRQAVEELGGLPGLRIHRSWWVARHAVVGSMQDGRNVRLRLANGLFAPVSRGSVAAARAFGLLTPAETYESADATLN
jgi:DNA-binding LytR/AlgR family response regulator